MVKQQTFLPRAGERFECVVPMEVNISAAFPQLTLPLSEKEVLALRPLLYSNCRTFQNVCYIGADGRYLGEGEVSAEKWADSAAAIAKRYDPKGVSARVWGRPADIRKRVQELQALTGRDPAALRDALDPDEDPAVLLQVIQRVKGLRGEGAARFWSDLIAWPNLYVQMVALHQLLTLGPAGMARAAELVKPYVEREHFGLDAKVTSDGPQLYRDVPGELAQELSKTDDPSHAAFLAAVYHSLPNWSYVDDVPDYFGRVARTGKREVGQALIDAISWPDSSSHPLTNPYNRPRIAKMFSVFARFGCRTREPDWDDPAAGVAALAEARRWWEERTKGK